MSTNRLWNLLSDDLDAYTRERVIDPKDKDDDGEHVD